MKSSVPSSRNKMSDSRFGRIGLTNPYVTHLKLASVLLLVAFGSGMSNSQAGMLDDLIHGATKDLENAVKKGFGQAGGAKPTPQMPQPTQNRPSPRDVYADRQAQATAERERNNQEIENETYTEAELREIEPLTYKGPSRTVDMRPSQVYAWRNGWEGRLISYHYVPLYRPANRGGPQPYKGFYRLICSYEANKSPGSMQFWYRRRPVTDIARPEDLQGSDAVVEACPQVYSEALKLVYGDDILDRATAFYEEKVKVGSMTSKEREAYFEQQREKKREERYGPYAAWDRDAKANSPARDLELVHKVNAAVASLQRSGRGLSVSELRQTLDSDLREDLVSLARSAKARLDVIPPGQKYRAAFDRWDNDLGGHVLLVLRRLSDLQGEFSTGDDADFVVAGESSGARAMRRNALRDSRDLDFIVPIHNYFATVFEGRLAGQPLLDRPYVEAMKKKLNATKLVSDKWRTTIDVPSASRDRDEQPELMTLDELAAAEFGGAIGRGLGGAMAGYMKVKQANAEFQQRITSARDSFWNCYASRCVDAPQRYYEYSKALRDKDIYYMLMPEVQMRIGGRQQAMGMEMFMGVMGSLEIDGGPGNPYCSSAWEEAKAGLTLQLGNWKPDYSNMDASREELSKRVARFTLSPYYLKWQQCRDYQEYIDRPRAPM